ncbi:MAG: hypothetical protein P9M07_07730 [Candidatus Aceula meridiana]|nr:hypothetical protein [Candidatus Aceula meridiana]
MFEILIMIAWIVGIVLGIMWLFLPWIVISKIDEVIEELRKFNKNAQK